MRFSSAFGLSKSQSELDFVDIDTSYDLKLFIDPYAIEIRVDDFSIELQEYLTTYFQTLLDALRSGQAGLATSLTSHLNEPEETFIGVSKGGPGKGVGVHQARDITAALRRSVSFTTGTLTDLAEVELFIPGISSDKLSDLTTNIIRVPLEAYTEAQCKLHDIPTANIAMPAAWNPPQRRWESHFANIPIVAGRPVLLIPKALVRRKLSLNSQEFYNHSMLDYLREEELRKGGSLVRVLRNGSRRVHKKDLKERHPFEKPALEEFARAHPKVLDAYKKIKGAKGPLTASDFDEEFSETAFAVALRGQLSTIPRGAEHASTYHHFMIGVMSFLFYPDLIQPVKEDPLHEGRKRIDITYTNAATDGFFFRMRTWPPTVANRVFFECKNYSSDVANSELDQLSGRFGHQRGRLGFLICRNIGDRPLLERRCKDTAADGRGFVIVLDDDDIGNLLELVSGLRRSQISSHLDARVRAIGA
jgi:hypothetical protein